MGVIELDETGTLDDELEDMLELDVLEETIGLLCEILDVTLNEELTITFVELLETVLPDEELEVTSVDVL